MSEHRDHTRRSLLCLYEEMETKAPAMCRVCCPANPNILNGESVPFNHHYMNVNRTTKIVDSFR